MGDPTIICPKCHHDIPLTESLAAPLLEATRQDFERQIADKDRNIAAREEALRSQQATLEKSRAEVDQQVFDKLQSERKRIAGEEAATCREGRTDRLNAASGRRTQTQSRTRIAAIAG